MRTAVITIAAGRHDHLLAQQRGLAASVPRPATYVVVAMGDPQIRGLIQEHAAGPDPAPTVVDVPVLGGLLPLAAARNAGAAAALHAGAELLIFLDVDCVPSKPLIARYEAAAALCRYSAGVLSGPVAYLPASAKGTDPDTWPSQAAPHPARPAPDDGDVVPADDPDLFWSLSFALTAETWRRIGGFCEDYRGYGGEDTDFARLALQAGASLCWVGGASAFHQHHDSQTPPVDHLEDILRNGRIFFRRWGRWPMLGWLEQFEAMGLVTRNPEDGQWRQTGPA